MAAKEKEITFTGVCLDTAKLMDKMTELASAERITKQMLGELSRDLLAHHVKFRDPALINRLLGTYDLNGKEVYFLTPMNWKLAAEYFRAYIPRASNWDDVVEYIQEGKGNRQPLMFDKFSKAREKKINAAIEKGAYLSIEDWLKDETNNIWKWAHETKVNTGKNKDFLALAMKALDKAREEGVSDVDLVKEIMGRIQLTDVMEAIAKEEPKAA